jgi:hypothetical protein
VIGRIRNAVLVLIACAFGLRLAWELVEPALPALVLAAFLMWIVSLLFRRSR